ncbi:hypothetical protein GCM10010376_95790 [Streptomyces violaceusniger]
MLPCVRLSQRMHKPNGTLLPSPVGRHTPGKPLNPAHPGPCPAPYPDPREGAWEGGPDPSPRRQRHRVRTTVSADHDRPCRTHLCIRAMATSWPVQR